MSLDDVIEALEDIINDGSDEDSISSKNSDAKSEGFFCAESTFSAKDVKVSVNNIGQLKFPIKENVIKKLMDMSEKAKFGKGTETVLDTSYRDTQMIPAEKLKVDINKQALDNFLQLIGQELKIEEHTNLELHLYNMLIYGPGQFFKRHQDSEKVPNMIATLVMVLPSPHKGGDLIIEHHRLKHRFFGSLNNKIIKSITFYSDCFHEVKEVDEGYRVAITYNVELKSGPMRGLTADESLKDAVNSYFEKNKSNKLVYLLDHEYTENSLRWYTLKGSDRICAKALMAVGKLEGHPPCLALADHHETWPEDDPTLLEKDIEFYFWIDENNIGFDSEKISVSEDEICFMMDTKKEFNPYNREEGGYLGNQGVTIEEWYHRSAVVLWRDTWAFVAGFKKEFHALHLLTAEPGKQRTLLKIIKNNSKRLFSSRFWNVPSVKKMALDIMIYLNDKETTYKILSKLKPSEVLDSAKNEKVVTWMATNCDLETWERLMNKWESTQKAEVLLQYLLPFLSNYKANKNKDLEIAGYLSCQAAEFLMEKILKQEKYIYAVLNANHINEICSFLKTCGELENTAIEQKIFIRIVSTPDITPSFLADLLVKIQQIFGDKISMYTEFKNRAIDKVQAELEKLKNPNDCSLSINHPCCCQNCRQVQNFFASKTSMKVIIPAETRTRAHTYKYLNPLAVYLPIKLETIRTGSPFKLTVTKLPQLLQDRKNVIQKLKEAKKAIAQSTSVEPPAAKKRRTR